LPAVDPIKVDGLRDLQASLKAMDGDSQKLLRLVLNDAADIVVQGAGRLIPRRSGRARASLKAQSSQREARVKEGSAKAPYAPWLDFGGRVGRNNSVKRPFLREGRFVYPTYNRRKPWIHDRLARGLEDLIRGAGLEPD
jgi:hypothetical protein